MGDNWDDDFEPQKPIQLPKAPAASTTSTAFRFGRGRGFVGVAKKAPSFAVSDDSWDESPSSNNNSGGWNMGAGVGASDAPSVPTPAISDDTWDESPSNNNNSGGWSDRARNNASSSNQFQDSDNGWTDDTNQNGGWSGGGGGGRGQRSTGGGGGEGRSKGCFKCGEEGHISRECPTGGGGGGGGGGEGDKKGCFKCGEDGHISKDCSSSGANKCFRCKEEGHISRDCPNSEGKRGCFKCGEEGHMSKECPNLETTRTTVGEDGKPREIYVPPETTSDENELFTGVPTGINFEKYDNIKVQVSGDNPPKPVLTFNEANLSQTLVQNIGKANYVKPTPVQKWTIPIVHSGRDLMACAQTGSGKTAAFLIPIIQAMFEASDLPNNSYSDTQEPWAVIVTPTRELTIQIHKEAKKFSLGSIVQTALIYGGTSVTVQTQRLRKGCHILVATPGRLNDFVEKEKVSFAQVKYFVLDEADRMLDMGFGPTVRSMVEHPTMPDKSQRQTLLFSATFPDSIQMMAKDFLKPDYLFLTVGMVGAANSDVVQTVLQVARFEKKDKLLKILCESGDNDRTLVFVETKRQADFVAAFISQKNFPSTSIHGDRLQREREEALHDFRTGRRPILTATAVAARGLDIRDVRHVINFDMPNTIAEYVHRIGRTGRVGNIGQSTSFFDLEKDADLAPDLIKILSDAQQEVPDWLAELTDNYIGGGGNTTFTSRDVRKDTHRSSWQDDSTVTNGEESWD